MKKVFIVTMNKYPEGDAGAVRQHAFALLFSQIGYVPYVIGYGNVHSGKYQGVEFVSLRFKSEKKLVRLLNRFLFGIRAYKRLAKQVEEGDILFVVDVLPIAFILLEKCARKHRLTLLHDSVEWYSPEEFRHGRLSIEYSLKEYTNTVAINKRWNVIAISDYLFKYFKSKGVNTIRIPVIMDVLNTKCIYRENNGKTVFVYAGGPGLKDYLREMIAGFALLSDSEKQGIEILIIGVDESQLLSTCKVSSLDFDLIRDCVKVLGKLERSLAKEIVSEADFAIFLRNENLRYAKAGFPTKFVESMMLGIPVICNVSSDIGLYLLDGENGIVVDGHDAESFKISIKKAISLSPHRRYEMKKKARAIAEQFFDYSKYCNKVSDFVNKK